MEIKKIALLALFAALTVGCNKPAKEIDFVVSNLTVSKDGDSDYSTTFKGSATISSSDQSLKGKSIIVFVSAKTKTGDEVGDFSSTVNVTDGVGKIEIYEFSSKPNAPLVSFSDWKTKGFWELSPATIEYK